MRGGDVGNNRSESSSTNTGVIRSLPWKKKTMITAFRFMKENIRKKKSSRVGGPVVRTSPSKAGVAVSVPGPGIRCLVTKKPKHKLEAILQQIQ